jgi:phosphatidylserine/phosphatidylglycerophosphate/cardiolipin synthase-like enzyme
MQLDTLWQLQADATRLDNAALQAIKKGQMRQAKKLLKQRLKLINSAFIQELLLFVSLQAEKENLADAKLIQLTANQWDSFQHLLARAEAIKD